ATSRFRCRSSSIHEPPMTRSRMDRRSLLACLLTVPYLAGGGEITYRFIDGYELTSARLEPSAVVPPPPPIRPDPLGGELLNSVTFDSTVSRQWFFQPPSPLEKPISPELDARDAANQVNGAQNYVWNDYYLRHPDAPLIDLMRRFKVKELFAFQSYDD